MKFMVCTATLLAASGIASAATDSPIGAPVGSTHTTPTSVATHTPGLTDSGMPLAATDAASTLLSNDALVANEASTETRGTFTGDGPLPASSTLQVELVSNPSAAALGLASQAENAWERGDVASAEAAMAAIERMGELVGGAYAYDQPQAVTGRAFDDAVVSAEDPEAFEFNVDPVTGNLFAVLDEGDTWTLHISTDDGATWAQTFNFGADPAHLDLAIVDGFVYVGYSQVSSQTQARLRRFSTATGAPVGSFEVVFETPALQQVDDIAIEGNEDSFNNRIFYAIIQSNNTIRWAFGNPNTPSTFGEISTNGVVDAASNLDMHWDTATSNNVLHLCYVSTTNQIRHIAFAGNNWDPDNTFIASHTGGPVRVAAEQDTVIISYRADNAFDPGVASVEYHISYNDGTSFIVGGLSGQGVSTGKFNPDVAARFGYGTGVTYNTEAGAFDPALVRRRAGYAPGPWESEITVNSNDLLSGGFQRIEALPAISSAATYSYGVMFETQLVDCCTLFTRIEDCAWLGDVDNDGDVELDDLLTVLASFGSFTGVGDTDGNGFVDLADLLTVLADFGNDCSEI